MDGESHIAAEIGLSSLEVAFDIGFLSLRSSKFLLYIERKCPRESLRVAPPPESRVVMSNDDGSAENLVTDWGPGSRGSGDGTVKTLNSESKDSNMTLCLAASFDNIWVDSGISRVGGSLTDTGGVSVG